MMRIVNSLRVFFMLACLVLILAAGCYRSAKKTVEPQVSPVTTAPIVLDNPGVPAGARQILKDHFIAFHRIQLDSDGKHLLVDFQAPSTDPQQIVNDVALFDWRSDKRVDNSGDTLQFRDDSSRHSLPSDSAAASHIGSTANVKVNFDGSRVAVWESGSAPLRILDTETGEQVCSLSAGIILNVAFSSDGQWIAAAGQTSDGAAVRIWDVETGSPKSEIDTVAYELGFSPNSKLLWTSSVLDREADLSRQQSTLDQMYKSNRDLAAHALQPVSLTPLPS